MLESHRQQPSGFMVVLMEMVPWIPSGSFFQRFSHENGWSWKNSGLVLWGKKGLFQVRKCDFERVGGTDLM